MWVTTGMSDTVYNVEPFFKWVDYTSGFTKETTETPSEYELTKDRFGPLYFVPIQCLKVNSF